VNYLDKPFILIFINLLPDEKIDFHTVVLCIEKEELGLLRAGEFTDILAEC